MSVVTERRQRSYLERPPSGGLADVVELILDKGLVIDAYIRISVVGIELITIDARIVIASVDTYLRFAEATNRVDLYEHGGMDVSELSERMSRRGAKGKATGVLDAAKEKVEDVVHPDDDDSDDREPQRARRPHRKEPAE